MKSITLLLTLLCAACFSALPAHAQQNFSSVAILNCPASSGPAITEPIFNFQIDVNNDVGYTNAYTYLVSDPSAFFTFYTAEAYDTLYPTCTLGAGQTSITFNEVTFIGVTIFGYGSGVLASYDPSITGAAGGSVVTACYTSFTTNGTTYPVAVNSCMSPFDSAFGQRTSGLAGRLTQGGR